MANICAKSFALEIIKNQKKCLFLSKMGITCNISNSSCKISIPALTVGKNRFVWSIYEDSARQICNTRILGGKNCRCWLAVLYLYLMYISNTLYIYTHTIYLECVCVCVCISICVVSV